MLNRITQLRGFNLKDRFENKKFQSYELDFSISNIDNDDFTVVIPVLNEEEGIGKIIQEIISEGYRNILVIDGYSTDKTVTVASENGVRVIYQHGVGKTGAIKTAIDNIDKTIIKIVRNIILISSLLFKV